MKVIMCRKKYEIKIKKNAAVLDIIKQLGLNSGDVVVRKDGKIVTEDEKVTEKDRIEIIRAVSSG